MRPDRIVLSQDTKNFHTNLAKPTPKGYKCPIKMNIQVISHIIFITVIRRVPLLPTQEVVRSISEIHLLFPARHPN